MAIQYSTAHRTGAMTDLNTQIGANAVIKIFTGSPPANCATADTGTLLVTFAGNAGGFGTVSNGVLTMSAVANATASNPGTAGYFRIYPNAATTTNAVMQGVITSDMGATNTNIAAGQTCTLPSFGVTAFGA